MSDTAINQITSLIVKGIAKGATAIAQATVRVIDVDHNALDVAINGALPTGSNTIGKVDQGTGGASAWKVDGSAVTQPVSGTVTATISGTPAVTVTSGTVSVSNFPATQPISGSVSVSNLPATQPVSGTVTAAQGAAGSTAWKVDGSSVTQPVSGSVSATISGTPAVTVTSGTVTANIGTTGSLALDATLTGGTQIAIAKGAAASGAAVSGNPVLVAGSDGTNARTIATDTSGRTIAVGAAATGAAVAGSPVYVAGIDGGGLVRPLLVSAAGNGQVSAAKGTTVSSSAAEASHVISASACLVAKIRGYNGNAGVRYFQGHNASSLPGNGAVPSVVSEQATSAHAQEVNFTIPTDRFSTGCVVATSSTGATLTIGAADATFTVDLFPSNV